MKSQILQFQSLSSVKVAGEVAVGGLVLRCPCCESDDKVGLVQQE